MNLSLWQACKYFFHLGLTGFGGPIALIAIMERDLVQKKNIVRSQDFTEALGFSQFMPGPVAIQLCMYLSHMQFGILGAALVSICFVLPSFVIVMCISYFYVQNPDLNYLKAILYGLGACVFAILLKSFRTLYERYLWKQNLKLVLALFNTACALLFPNHAFLFLFVSAFIYLLVLLLIEKYKTKSNPKVQSIFFAFPGMQNINLLFEQAYSWFLVIDYTQIFLYFFKTGALVFGSGLAIIPVMQVELVEKMHWISQKDFLNALSVAFATPGPAVIVSVFLGYLLKSFWGGVLAALGIFLPVFLITISLAKFYSNTLKKSRWAREYVNALVCSSIGALIASLFHIGQESLSSVFAVLVFLFSAIILYVFKKIPDVVVLLVAAVAGLVFY